MPGAHLPLTATTGNAVRRSSSARYACGAAAYTASGLGALVPIALGVPSPRVASKARVVHGQLVQMRRPLLPV